MDHLKNQILQGDVLEELSNLPPNTFQAVIADPPYFNVLDEEWDTQWKNPVDYVAWSERWVVGAMRTLKEDGLCFVFGQVGKREHTFLHLMSKLTTSHQFHDLVIWDRVIGYNERRDSFTPQYEMALVLRKGDSVKFNKDAVRVPYDSKTIETYLKDKRYKDMNARRAHLEAGKFSTNIISVPSLKGASKEKCGHPSQKPERLIANLVLCSTDPGDFVLDPFLGSGTTAVVAQRSGRCWTGIERSPEFVAMAKKRLELEGAK